MAASSSPRPSWQRHAIFKFFASIKLAVVLLAVLIVGAIAGTIYESTFDAKVARAYVYGAPWFNLWLMFLAANLTFSALSRWPWKKHHVAFLITHLGIITLLAGSLIGRTWGIEGTITLFKGEPASNRLLVDQHQLRVHDTDGVTKGYTTEFINHPPSAQKPWDLGALAGGAQLQLVEYAPALEAKLNPRTIEKDGLPAVHISIATAMMGQQLESWLLADDPQHGSFDMGLATIRLKRGQAAASSAPAPTPFAPNESKTNGAVELEESFFAFAKAPDQQIAKAGKGGSTGAKVQLEMPAPGGKGKATIVVAGQTATLEVAESLGKDVPLAGTPFVARVENYWPDFRIENGKPGSVSEQPNNPALMLTLRGRAPPVAAAAPDPHGAPGIAPAMPAAGGEASANQLTIFIAADGALSYELASRKAGRSSGSLPLDQPLPTGWADWKLTADKIIPHAEQWMDFNPVNSAAAPGGANAELPDGVRVRVTQGGKTIEQWVPAGWQINVPTAPQEIQVSYGWKQIPLPIGLELTDFEVQRNEGSDTPAGFKSTLRITSADGDVATGQCWMNHPFSYPAESWRTWTGLTYKMSQASWNPDNLGQSTIQILRDPGWSLKWVGSLLIVSGIFMLFYLRGFRRPTPAAPKIDAVKPKRKTARALAAAES